jgi:putative ABC transport system substrate-binding protein
MQRRELIAAIAGALAWPRGARAQRSSLPVVGFLGVLSAADTADLLAVFNQGLNGDGFLDGRNVAVEGRWAEGRVEQLRSLADDLVKHRAIVIVAAGGGAATLAAKASAAGVTPIVFIEGDLDPIKSGLVASPEQPGGNITGVLLSSPTLLPKRLELLQEAAPGADVIGMLANPQSLDAQTQLQQAQQSARAKGVPLKVVNATNPDEIDDVFANAFVKPQIDALIVGDDMLFLSERDRIVAAAAANGLPTIYAHRAFVIAGGLMSYAANPIDAYRHAAELTADILLGRRPAELPVVPATTFQFVVNRRTAAALHVPDALVGSADRIIE